MRRIHIAGGEDLSRDLYRDVARLYAGDRRAMHALLASQGLGYYQLGQAPVHVGADVMTQPDGSSANVEPLPIAPVAGVSVAAGATQPFSITPTRPYQPTALILDDDIAKNLVFSSFTIGGQPVQAATGGLIGRGFSQGSFNNVLSSYWADNNAPIAFDVLNIHASAAQVVRGHFLGNSVRRA